MKIVKDSLYNPVNCRIGDPMRCLYASFDVGWGGGGG